MAAQGPPKGGPIHATPCGERGGGPLEDYKNPIRTGLGILPRLNVPKARWRITWCFILHRFAFVWFCLDLYCCIALPCICFAKFCVQCFALRCTCIWIPCQYVALHCHCVDSSPSTALHCFAFFCMDVLLPAICICSVRVFIRLHLVVKPVVGQCLC